MWRLGRHERRRVTRHASFGAGVAVLTMLLARALEGSLAFRLSMATAYVSLALLAVALMLGPWNVLRGRPNPVSSTVRRDTGIWAAVLALAHVVFGLQVHLPGAMLQYFVTPPAMDRPALPRLDLAGGANWSGLAAALLLLLLLALSNDVSLRRLGTTRWKGLQRWNYAAFALIALHGAAYQVLERRSAPWIAVFASMVVVVIVVQIIAFRRHRARRHAL